jgi:hypothetical protein
MFGSASFVAHSKVERADIVNGDLEVYVHRMGLLAQAKSSSEDDLDAYRKMLNQSEGGRAVLESFLMIWPTIKEAAEAMIETGDLSGKQFSAALQLVEQGLSPTLRYWEDRGMRRKVEYRDWEPKVARHFAYQTERNLVFVCRFFEPSHERGFEGGNAPQPP